MLVVWLSILKYSVQSDQTLYLQRTWLACSDIRKLDVELMHEVSGSAENELSARETVL